MIAHARKSDPMTSQYAAQSVTRTTELQARILQCFEMSNGLTDEELIALYRKTFGISHPATDSSLRTRRSDLHYSNAIQNTGQTRPSQTGRKSIVWDVAGYLL